MFKNYGMAMLSLLLVLIGLMFVLNVLKKAPVIGPIAEKVDNLATEGHL